MFVIPTFETSHLVPKYRFPSHIAAATELLSKRRFTITTNHSYTSYIFFIFTITKTHNHLFLTITVSHLVKQGFFVVAEMAGIIKPQSGFVITPHKVSICILLQVYAPSGQLSVPFPFASISQHNRLGLFLIALTKVKFLLILFRFRR